MCYCFSSPTSFKKELLSCFIGEKTKAQRNPVCQSCTCKVTELKFKTRWVWFPNSIASKRTEWEVKRNSWCTKIKDKPGSGVSLKSIFEREFFSQPFLFPSTSNCPTSHLQQEFCVFFFKLFYQHQGASHILPYDLFSRQIAQLGQRRELVGRVKHGSRSWAAGEGREIRWRRHLTGLL